MLGLGLETSIAVLGIVVLTAYFHYKYDENTLTNGATILTTTGIFATFLGIALGLLNFDANNIESSVPALLQGLKTAFWASVVGVGGALTLKLRNYFTQNNQKTTSSDVPDEVSAKDILISLKEIRNAIVGNEDSALVSQIKLLRQDSNDRLDSLKKDNNDRLDALREAQIEALQKLSEMSSKTLIEALKGVILDFNNKITEQFGDNFKQLNEAVGKILVWQDEYKDFVVEITAQCKTIVSSMDSASKDYQELVTQTEVFTKNANKLSALLTAQEEQKKALYMMLKSLAELLKSSEQSLPQIEKKIVQLTEQLTSAIQNNQAQIRTTITEFDDSTKKLIEKTSRQTNEFNAGIERAVSDSIKSLGNHLTAMTEKFAYDYKELSTALAKISAATRRIGG